MSRRLQGKAALVTGGSRGIGAAIAKRLAAEGADVVVSYVSSAGKAEELVQELKSAGVQAHAVKADQADGKQVEALVETAVEKLGRLDILVNNAGVAAFSSLHDAADTAALERMTAINVTAVATAVRKAAPYMKEGGRIINIGSVVGDRQPFGGAADYSMTKAAVVGYTRGWARDLGPKGITVNVIQPGPIQTDMNPGEGEFAEMLTKLTALGRFGKPEEIASAVAFLASPEAAYITGTALTVDGGMNA